MSARACSRWSATVGELLGEGIDDPVELGMHRRCVGLVVVECSGALTQPQLDLGVADIRVAV